jgi:hypothetical protein
VDPPQEGKHQHETGVLEGPTAPSVRGLSSLKGGRSIRELGETFAVNPPGGSASMAIPLALSPGGRGFAPELALRYDSSRDNGPFGLGSLRGRRSMARRNGSGAMQFAGAWAL